MIKLKTNSFYCNEFQKIEENNFIELYSKLPNKDFPALREIMMKMATAFGSINTCKQISSRMKHIKSVHVSQLTDEYLDSILKIGTTKFQPNFSLLINKIQSQVLQ